MTHIMWARNRNRPPMFEAEMKILVCNAGSSSLKFSLFEAEEELLLAEGGVDWSRKPTRLVFRRTGEEELREELKLEKHADAIVRILDDLQAGPSAALDSLEDLRAVGHRVVHGGERYTSAVRITPEVKQAIEELAELAPLHNPPALDGITAVEQVPPGRTTGGSIRHCFSLNLVRGGSNLSGPPKMDARVGHAPLRLPRFEPFVLRRSRGRDDRPAGLANRDRTSWEWRVGLGGSARRVCRYLDGFCSAGRLNDGDAQRVG